MGWIDVALILILAAACIIGFGEGIVRQIASIVGILLGILCAWLFGEQLTEIVRAILGYDASDIDITEQFTAAVIGYGLLFVIPWALCCYFSYLIHKFLDKIYLGFIDNILGAIFLPLKWALIISLVLNAWFIINPTSSVFFSPKLFDGKLFSFIFNLVPRICGYLEESSTNLTAVML